MDDDVRVIAADILRGLGRQRWRAARGRTMEFGGPELRDLINLRRAEFALRWVAKREAVLDERDLLEEVEQLREENNALESARDDQADEIKRLKAALTEARKKIKEGESA